MRQRMSDEKLAEEFIEKRWPNFKHCVLLESNHRDLYCRCDLSYSFIAGLKAEREKSKKLVDVLRIYTKVGGFSGPAIKALEEYEKEGAE